MKAIKVNAQSFSYDVFIGKGMLDRCGEFIALRRRVMIVTDSGVPEEYAQRVADKCNEYKIFRFKDGEGSKSLDTCQRLLLEMMDFNMSRRDLVVAVGGGVVGDLAGLCASLYMRGIDFCNIPTTLLSQLDSSIGGKTAVNLGGVKNIVGAFYPPKCVLIDPDVLKTLTPDMLSCGMAEAIKMAATSDAELFEFLEEHSLSELDGIIEDVVYRSLLIKKNVVEKDERESGLRQILNFGHTLGHGIEALGGVSHGQAVAYGCLVMTSDGERGRLANVFSSYGLSVKYEGDVDKALELTVHDKKASGDYVNVIKVDKIGIGRIEATSSKDFCATVKERI